MRVRATVAVDLGTVNTLVWVAGRGLVIEEPSAVAIEVASGAVKAIGTAADVLSEKEPQGLTVVHPLRDGVIADLDAAAAMLHGFLKKARPRGLLTARVLVCVPGEATAVERRSVLAAVKARRPRYKAALIDEPVAAAAGAGLDLDAGAGGLVVDVGGGTAEVAAVAGWRVVRARTLRLAGNAMDAAIARAVRAEVGLILSERGARQLKVSLGLTGGEEGWTEVVGLDAATRAPRTERIGGDLVAEAVEPVVSAIGAAVGEILSDIPPGLAEDVVRGKIRLCGGGGLLSGLAARIEESAGIGTVAVEDPLRCVIRGAAKIMTERDPAAPGPLLLNSRAGVRYRPVARAANAHKLGM